MIGVGDTVPAMTLALSDGTSVNLAGDPVVLYFYPKDDTSGCTREAQDFTALAVCGSSASRGTR
jgi:peroxiredoxin Q/BCP